MKKVLFIGGSSFSGSTMLDMMLANSPDGFSVGEIQALFRPYRPHHFSPVCGCGNPECDLWKKVLASGEKRLYQTIFNEFPEISFIVDSSKNPWWINRQTSLLEQQGIMVYHLLIYKEPGDFAHSMVKRGRKTWKRAWKNYYRLYLSLIENFIPVPYKDLAQKPAETISSICLSCGLEFHQDREKFWEKQHHTLFGNDSAKIHLYSEKNKNYHVASSRLPHQDTVEGRHQSIYYDNKIFEKLPDDVKQEITADRQLQQMRSFFSGEKASKERNAIVYNPFQLNLNKFINSSELLAGRTLGRFFRLL
ncbi:MAG: hypothetical protein NDI81_14475 [Desulfobacula sp.]|nr:hypothetical protein [Desulfobacula sp.]